MTYLHLENMYHNLYTLFVFTITTNTNITFVNSGLCDVYLNREFWKISTCLTSKKIHSGIYEVFFYDQRVHHLIIHSSDQKSDEDKMRIIILSSFNCYKNKNRIVSTQLETPKSKNISHGTMYNKVQGFFLLLWVNRMPWRCPLQ